MPMPQCYLTIDNRANDLEVYVADDEEDPWLTLAEIAEELHLTPATIRSWVSSGTLRAWRPGKRKYLV
jgi:excisionase family DNA binding protein